jgi:hypothetical protein
MLLDWNLKWGEELDTGSNVGFFDVLLVILFIDTHCLVFPSLCFSSVFSEFARLDIPFLSFIGEELFPALTESGQGLAQRTDLSMRARHRIKLLRNNMGFGICWTLVMHTLIIQKPTLKIFRPSNFNTDLIGATKYISWYLNGNTKSNGWLGAICRGLLGLLITRDGMKT